jgi:DNA processing protein
MSVPLLPCWTLNKEAATSLYAQGSPEALKLLDRLHADGLAVVGTRQPLARSVQMTQQWIRALAGTQRIVVSGFARGIDTVAHEAALDSGLPTVAFLGTALDVDYPTGHRRLRERVLTSNGLLISETPQGADTYKSRFAQRNRLIAACSRATLVIEAGATSGPLITARYALEFSRDRYIVPCLPGDSRFAGNQYLLQQDGAKTFWGPHSLSDSWYDFELKRPASLSRDRAESPRAQALLELIAERSSRVGGIPLPEAIDWAMARDWPPGEFFAWLENRIADGRILQRGQMLAAGGR